MGRVLPIKYVQTKSGQDFLPITHMRAVRDDNGNNVESIVGAINSNITDLSTVTQNIEEMIGTTTQGKIYLRATDENHGVLSQSMINQADTIYVVVDGLTLSGQTIEVPSNCVLDFDGGYLEAGTLNINGATIYPSYNNLSDRRALLTLQIVGNPGIGTFRFSNKKPSWWSGTDWVDGEGVNLDTAIVNV